MDLFDIHTHDEWQTLLDEFASLIGMPTALFNQSNEILVTSGVRNTICSSIRASDHIRSLICGPSQAEMATTAKQRGAPLTDFCKARFLKTVIPIRHEGSYQGGITACGSCQTGELPDLEYCATLLQEESDALRNKVIGEIDRDHLHELAVTFDRHYRSGSGL